MTDAQILQLLGLAYFAVGVGALINPKLYMKILDDYIESLPIIYINGFIILAIGFLLVTFHNIWNLDWSIIITIIGWVALIKGLFMLALPQPYIMIAKAMRKKRAHLIIEAAMITLIGATLMYIGYFIA